MQILRKAGLACLLAAGLAAVSHPALADDPAAGATEKLEESVQNFLSAMKLFLLAIPQYAAPEVMPNGDIIIRRLKPGEEQDKKSDDPPDSRKI